MPAPRVFIIRHGETEWSLSGQYTGSTDIPLTKRGILQIQSTRQTIFGKGKMIDVDRVVKVFVSPRQRALKTLALLVGEDGDGEGDGDGGREVLEREITEELREWEYGLYEGLLTREIRVARKERGLDREMEWDIWRDGCEEGESPKQVSDRLDSLIAKIRHIQSPHMGDDEPADVLLVAHGHILRAFVKRWLGYSLEFRLRLMLDPGGVGVLTYDHKSLEEPAMLAGIGFPFKEASY